MTSRAPLSRGYRNTALGLAFLRGQSHKFTHLRWAVDDLRDFARSSEKLLDRRRREARDPDRFALSPWIVRSSILLMACGVLESFLTEFCELLYQSEGFAQAPGEISGRGIVRARTYIKKVARLPFPDVLWEKLRALFYVRNAIAHENGKLTDARKRRCVEKSFSAVTVEKAAGEVWPEEAATEDAMNLLAEFAKRLEEDVVGPI